MRPALALRCPGTLAPATCVEQARAAERAGFATIWFPENPFGRGAWPSAAACAIATRRLRIGLGVFNPFNRHPTLMAMEVAAFDELSEGRAVLGIGTGIPSRVKKLQLPVDRPIAAVRDAVHIVRALLRGETVTYTGKVFAADAVRLEFEPRRASLPILTAAMGDQALRLCGEIADGVMISNLAPPAFARRAAALVRESAARAGRPAPWEVVHYVPCVVREDGNDARRVAKQAVATMLSSYWTQATASVATRTAIVEYNGVPREEFARLMGRLAGGEAAADVLDDRLLAQYAIAGTAAECLERCTTYAECGVTELGLGFIGDHGADEIAQLARAM